jgi:hypothetical protein
MLAAIVDAQNILLFIESLLDFFQPSIVHVTLSVERLSLCFHFTKLNLHLKQYTSSCHRISNLPLTIFKVTS